MSGTYTNAEYYDMIMCLGAAEGNAAGACRLYEEQFVEGRPPERQRRLPSDRCFLRLSYRLRTYGAFVPPTLQGRPSADCTRVVDKVLEAFNKNPHISAKKVAAQCGVSFGSVLSILKDHNWQFERRTASNVKNCQLAKRGRGRPKKSLNGKGSPSVLDTKKCVCCQAARGSVAVYESDNGTNYPEVLRRHLGVTLHIPESSLKKSKLCERCESFLQDAVVFRDRLAASSHAQLRRDSHSDSDDLTLSQLMKKRPTVKGKIARVHGRWKKLVDTDDDDNCSWEDSDDEEPPRPVKRSRVPAVSKPVIEIKEEDLDADIDLVLNTDVYD